MALSAGDKLGAGGMGEVWKARDTRLERTVAIKRSLPINGEFTAHRLLFSAGEIAWVKSAVKEDTAGGGTVWELAINASPRSEPPTEG